MINSKIIELAATYNMVVTKDQNEQFLHYLELLSECNKKFNLTAIKEPEEAIEKHFLDSILVLRSWQPKAGQKVVDIGTGGGFPGVVLAIMYPETDFCLLDSVNKKISFLDIVKEELQLKNIFPLWKRTEDLTKRGRESFDAATARAVAPLDTLLEYAFPLIKVNGILIAMKGPNAETEIKEARPAITEFGAEIIQIDVFSLPTAGTRNNLIIKKRKKTPAKYPRDPGIAKKNRNIV